MVPVITIAHKDTDIKNAPILFYGYGSYGINIDASFRSSLIPLLNKGFVFSIIFSIYSNAQCVINFSSIGNPTCFNLSDGFIKVDISGGASPYSILWIATGDTELNITNIAPSITPYTLHITDTNGCQKNQYLTINTVQEMQTFMSNDDVICKDDNSGMARVYVENGTPPFTFVWNTEEEFMDIESSRIENLYPGTYSVIVTDIMGCIISDSITISSNPKSCIIVYSVFSPNDDGIHDYWEIENIHLYPEALIEVYDRMGNMVYRRRNYINAEEHAFGGKDQEGRKLPSGTYYYIIDLENEDTVFKGALTIIR